MSDDGSDLFRTGRTYRLWRTTGPLVWIVWEVEVLDYPDTEDDGSYIANATVHASASAKNEREAMELGDERGVSAEDIPEHVIDKVKEMVEDDLEARPIGEEYE